MTREEALTLVREHVKNEGLVRHMLCVEAAMRFYAEKFSEDPEKWGLVGLLHDFDWEIHPTLEQHPQDGAAILRQRGVDEETISEWRKAGADGYGVGSALYKPGFTAAQVGVNAKRLVESLHRP